MFGERNSFVPPRSQGRDLVKNTVNGNVISQYDYAHDALGRRTSAAKSGTMMAASENLAYGYNARSELTSAVSDVDANYNYAYAFDHIGNRATETVAGTQSSYSTNALNQYDSISLGEAVSSPLSGVIGIEQIGRSDMTPRSRIRTNPIRRLADDFLQDGNTQGATRLFPQPNFQKLWK